jgi:hypothetical protein
MSEEQQVIAVEPEPEISISEYREDRAASQAGNPYKSPSALTPPLPPGERQARQEAKVSARREALQRVRRATEAELAEIERGRYGISEPGPQPPAEPAKPEAGVDTTPVRGSQAPEQPEAAKPETQQPPIPENLSEQDRAFHEQHHTKRAELAARLNETAAADPDFADACKACAKVMMPAAAQIAIVESRNSHEIAMHLTRNVHEVERLTQRWQDTADTVYGLTGDANLAQAYANQFAIGEIQRLSAGLEYGNGGRSRSEVVRKPISQAPEPIKPVGGTAGPAVGDIEQMSMSDYRKHRERGRL